MNRFLVIALVGVLLVSLPLPAGAQDGSPQAGEPIGEALNEQQAALAGSYVQATRQNSLGAFWALVHPVNLACQGEQYKKLIEVQEFGWLINKPIPENYMATIVPVEKEKVTAWYERIFGTKTAIPVMPTHAIILSYDQPRGACKPKRQRRVVFTARNEDGKWYEVFPCPKMLPMSPSTFQMKMAAMYLEADGLLVAMPEDTRQRIKDILVRSKAVDYAKDLLVEDEINPEIAEIIIDKICERAATEKP